jgi:Tol biopolymer transport system component
MSIARSLITIIAGVVVIPALTACRGETPPRNPTLRLALEQPAELQSGDDTSSLFGLALAPDGRRLAFSASTGSGSHHLWLRDLTTDTIQPLTSTTGAILPFWSPDGSGIGFFAGGKLRTLSLADGSIRDLAEAPSPRGGAWHREGHIVFAPHAKAGLKRRDPDGTLTDVTSLAPGETSHGFPQFVSSTHLAFFVESAEPTRQGIWIAPVNSAIARQRLVNSEANALAIDDVLVYASGQALVAQPIDLEKLALVGRPELLGSQVGRDAQHHLFATTGGDVLLFGRPMSNLRELRWVDDRGAAQGTLGEPMIAWDVRIAPAGRRVAVARVDPQLATLDIWAYEAARPIPRRVSPAIDADESPAWSRDASRIAWVSGRRSVVVRDSRVERPERTLQQFDDAIRVSDWSPDGRWIVLSASRSGSGSDILLLPADSSKAPVVPYVHSPFNEMHGTVSPDGRWLAYASDESGRSDVYVDSFPKAGTRARFSMGGGGEPRWSRDGASIYYRRGSELHRVSFTINAGTPLAAASEQLFDAGAEIRSFDIAPDDGFLLNLPAPGGTAKPLTALVNVRSLLPSAP